MKILYMCLGAEHCSMGVLLRFLRFTCLLLQCDLCLHGVIATRYIYIPTQALIDAFPEAVYVSLPKAHNQSMTNEW